MAKDPQTLPLLEVSDQQSVRYQEQARKADTRFLYQALRLMNQCDMGYRTSSNKRLLVELTLIEIAQITQPDDSTGSGRQPRKLKNLFKKLMAAPQRKEDHGKRTEQPSTQPEVKSAPQVAAAVVNKEGGKRNEEGGKLKLSGITTSWNNLRQQSQPRVNLNLNTGNGQQQTEQQVFSQEDLELQWMSMCNRMPQRLSGIAARMKNMNPVIVATPQQGEAPSVEVTVPNEIIKAEMDAIKGSIVKTLQIYLHNSAITLSLRVAEQQEQEKMLTRREQFEAMRRENASVEKLREVFDLELA